MTIYSWNNQELIFRQATREELNYGIQWASDEGWNPGLYDADIFWNTDPRGFVCIERNSQIIGVGSTVSYENFGFMGFFIIRKDLRNQSIGAPFWHWRKDQLLKRLAPNSSIGMDGVIEMQPFYTKGGFTKTHQTKRMMAVGKPAVWAENIIELKAERFEQIKKIDNHCFGFNRERFLRQWIMPIKGISLGILKDETLSGFGVIRACQEGYKIAPLFADNLQDADSLYTALSAFAEGQNVYLDTPEVNKDAIQLATRHGMQEVFACARMYYGQAPSFPWNQIYGLTSFELG